MVENVKRLHAELHFDTLGKIKAPLHSWVPLRGGKISQPIAPEVALTGWEIKARRISRCCRRKREPRQVNRLATWKLRAMEIQRLPRHEVRPLAEGRLGSELETVDF